MDMKKKFFYSLLLWATYVGFNIENIVTIGQPLESFQRFYIFSIPARDLALLMMLAVFIFHLKEILIFVKKEKVFLFLFILWVFTLQGIFMNGFVSVPFIRADLRVLLWFLGGISFCLVLIKTYRVRLNLTLMVGLTTAFLVLSSLYGEESSSRIANPNIFMFMGFLFTPLILLFSINRPRLKYQLLPVLSIAAISYYGTYLTQVRSMLLVTAIIVLVYLFSFGYKKKDNFIGRIQLGKAGFVLLILIAVITCLFSLMSDQSSSHHLTKISSQSVFNDIRFVELGNFFDQNKGSMSIIFGRGLGGTINSIIQKSNAVGTMHIGIANFWMKMGLVPFVLVSIFLFVKVPYVYIKTLFNPENFAPFKRTANLVVLPAIFPWILLLLISGGFGEGNFLFAGFVYLMHKEICKNGLERVSNAELFSKNRIRLVKRISKSGVSTWVLKK